MEIRRIENKNKENSLNCMDTPEWLRSFKGCEHYTDAEAMMVLDSLNQLAAILLRNASHKTHVIDNQIVVNLQQEETLQKIAA
jgi:hypothetical protein